MDTSKQTISQLPRYKTYPKSERVYEYHKEVVKLNKKGPRIVHHMVLNYEYILQSAKTNQLKNLDRPLEKLKQIEALFLYLFESNDWILFKMSQKLKSLSSLHILKIQTPYSRWVSLDGMTSLAYALSCMKNLHMLILNFQSCHWQSDDNFSILFQGLRRLRSLKSLELDLNFNRELKEKNFKSLAQAFKRLKSLQEFNLSFVHVNLNTPNTFNSLISALRCLATSLRKLQITLASLKDLTANDIYSFMSLLKDFDHLESLNLSFTGLNIDATALEHLSESFKSLTKLKALHLYFSDSQIEIEILAHNFSSLSLLNNLSLRFERCHNINDQNLQNLSVGLKTLNKLSRISLSIPNCKKIGDSGVESITSVLGELPNLKSVTLDFLGCKPIENSYYNVLKMNKEIKCLQFYYTRFR